MSENTIPVIMLLIVLYLILNILLYTSFNYFTITNLYNNTKLNLFGCITICSFVYIVFFIYGIPRFIWTLFNIPIGKKFEERDNDEDDYT